MDRDMTIDFGFDFPFDIDFDDSVARDVQRYVREVVSKLGLRGDSSCVEMTPRVSAYVALDGRLRDFPDHYVALVWNEQSGWSVAVEDRLGELVEVARFGGEPRPAPAVVAGWVDRVLHEEQVREQGNRDFAAFVPVQRAAALS
ncbi:hypothetical protein DFR72_12282 [Lentzea flaviverrucosa]|uniref:DUF6292 domain-containing protein n=2 Tax=Lentzea flaviverrucosa TaxID=200379 RepID=A0A1H9XXK4_9PSEU|nr:hypothetical protein DFR72_12282 [Lentzea flaviverrucosa]SES50809.1 hypothetical protein SAMN05216195_12247 [Lentzea flaviverrucosa]